MNKQEVQEIADTLGVPIKKNPLRVEGVCTKKVPIFNKIRLSFRPTIIKEAESFLDIFVHVSLAGNLHAVIRLDRAQNKVYLFITENKNVGSIDRFLALDTVEDIINEIQPVEVFVREYKSDTWSLVWN